MKVYNHKDAFIHLQYIFKTRGEDAFLAVFDETAVHYGSQGGFDRLTADKLQIPCYDIQKEGGAMVTSPGDVVYCFITRTHNSHFNMELRDFLAKKLQQIGVPVEQTKNDLLVGGRKCFGFMHKKLNHRAFYGGHISVDCNLELIKKICTKPMVKVPGGLSEYGITTSDVVNWLQEF